MKNNIKIYEEVCWKGVVDSMIVAQDRDKLQLMNMWILKNVGNFLIS